MPQLCELPSPGLIRFSGADARDFLHNQLTCDVGTLAPGQSVYGSYCTPKGRVLATFLLWRVADDYFMQLPAVLREAIQKRLSMYVLRSKVTVENAGLQSIMLGLSGDDAPAHLERALGAVRHEEHQVTVTGGTVVIRLPGARYEILVSSDNAPAILEKLKVGTTPMSPAHWEWMDIRAGIPTITPATQEQFVPQMVNLDLIGGLSFSKGCYPGQEIVARMHFLGRLKQRMYLANVATSGADGPQPGDKVYSAELEGQASGTVVNAAPAPDGGSDVLAVLQISATGSAVHWRAADGPLLKLLPLPYEVPASA